MNDLLGGNFHIDILPEIKDLFKALSFAIKKMFFLE